MKFRHFLRHVYGDELDPAKLSVVQAAERTGGPSLEADLNALDQWLEAPISAG